MEAITELVETEDARAIGEMNARYDIVTVIVEIPAGVLYDLDYTSTDSDHTSCPALWIHHGIHRGHGGGEGVYLAPGRPGDNMHPVITMLVF